MLFRSDPAVRDSHGRPAAGLGRGAGAGAGQGGMGARLWAGRLSEWARAQRRRELNRQQSKGGKSGKKTSRAVSDDDDDDENPDDDNNNEGDDDGSDDERAPESAEPESELTGAAAAGPGARFAALDWRRDALVEPLDEAKLKRQAEAEAAAAEAAKRDHEAKARASRKKAESRAAAEVRAAEAAAVDRAVQAALKKKQDADDAAVRTAAEAHKAKVGAMGERELRAEAMRRRLAMSNPAMAGKVERCAHCQEALVTVPFERLTYKYCSTKCLRAHKAIVG